MEVPCVRKADLLPERGRNRQAWVCMLLVFLFLHNPYLSAPGSAGGLNVKHPASHRATVGSSELERYSAMGDERSNIPAVLFFAAFRFSPAHVASHSLPIQCLELQ